MSDDNRWNSVVEEKPWLEAINAAPIMQGVTPPNWDGMPQSPPDLWMKAWFIDPYWYIVTSNGTFRVISNDQNTTDDDVIFTVREQVRLLLLPDHRKVSE